MCWRRCRTHATRAGGAIRWPGCWRSRSWRPRPGCAGTPGSPRGPPPLRRKCSPDWVFGFDGRARRRSGRCCRGWTRLTWIAGSGRTSPQPPPPRRWPPAGCWPWLWTARHCAARAAWVRPRTWSRSSPTARGWCLASSRSPKRATKYPACERFSAPSAKRDCWSRWTPCTLRPRRRKLICGTLKSHYLMIVKSNQPKLLARIQALPWAQVPLTHSEESQPAHGRVETRTLKVLTTARGIGFPHARQVIQIIRDRVAVATGERSREIVYAICSVAFEHAHPRTIASWLRDHWSIENAVHWVRDVTFDEDRSTVRTGTAPQVMASLRNTALNLHRLAGADNIAEACRVTAFRADRGLNLLENPQITRSQAC